MPFHFRFRPSALERAVCMRQLAVMLRSGVPLPRAVRVLTSKGINSELAGAWRDVLQNVYQGRGLARGMALHSRVFSLMEVGLVRAAERSSCLVETLEYLADYLEREYKLAVKIKQAIRYPLVVMTLAFLACVAFTTHILPIFMSGLEMDTDLPTLTKCLLFVSKIFGNPSCLVVLLSLVVVIGFLAYRYYRTPWGRCQWQCSMLRWYWLGDILKQTVLARFCRALSVLLHSGMPLKLSLDVAGDALGYYPLSQAVHTVSGDIRDGYRLSEAFKLSKFFPRYVSSLLSVSEENGSYVRALESIGEHYEQQVAMALEQFTALLEPLMLAVVGLVMGISMVGMFLPMYNCIGKMG